MRPEHTNWLFAYSIHLFERKFDYHLKQHSFPNLQGCMDSIPCLFPGGFVFSKSDCRGPFPKSRAGGFLKLLKGPVSLFAGVHLDFGAVS